MRAWFVMLIAACATACAGPSPDPRAMADDLPSAVAGAELAGRAAEIADRAVEALAAEQFDAARSLADQALAIDPRNGRARAVAAHGMMRDALIDSPPTLALWRRAEGELLRAERLAPEDPVVARLHATFLMADGHLTAAAERAERGLAGAPDDDVELLSLAARLRFDLGDERAALPHLGRLVELTPDDADVLWRRAQCEARLAGAETDAEDRLARLEAAITAFASYRAMRPSDVDGLLAEAGVRLARMGEVEVRPAAEIEAVIALYDDAARQRPESAEPEFGQGAALELAGRDDEARSAYRAALAIDAGHVPSLLNLAASLAAIGERAAAIPLLQRALELGVTDDERSRIADYVSSDGDR